MLKIVDIRLKEVQDRLSERKITFDVDQDAKQYLMSAGYSPQYGARPLNRVIQSEILNPLSVLILSGQVLDGEVVRVRFDGARNRVVVLPNHAPSKAEGEMDVDGEDVTDDDDIEIEEMD